MARKPNKKPAFDSQEFDLVQATRTKILPWQFLAASRIEKIPEGFYSSETIAKAAGLSAGSVGRHLVGLRRAGAILEERKFTIQAGPRIMPVWHYRLSQAAVIAYNLSPDNGKSTK